MLAVWSVKTRSASDSDNCINLHTLADKSNSLASVHYRFKSLCTDDIDIVLIKGRGLLQLYYHNFLGTTSQVTPQGSQGTVQTGDQLYPLLCHGHCISQLGEDIPD